MKTSFKLLLIAALLLTILPMGLQAAPRDFRKVDPSKHAVIELMNVQYQAVIDSVVGTLIIVGGDTAGTDSGWIALAPAEIGKVSGIVIQDLYQAYASMGTYLFSLHRGAARVWFTEQYFVGMNAVIHADSSHIIIDSLATIGEWSYDIPFLGCKELTIYIEALGPDSLLFIHGIQKMRD